MRRLRISSSLTILVITAAVAIFAFGFKAGAEAPIASPSGVIVAPAAPTELEAHVVHDVLLIEVRWQDNADNEDSYVIERSTEAESGPWSELAILLPDSINYYDVGLEDGATYWYRVAAANSAGTSGYSNVASGTATGLPTPPATTPAAPTELEAHVVHDALMIEVRWQDNADNEGSYVIERSLEGEEGPWAVLATLAADSSNYYDTGLQDGVTYWYRVAAVNSEGASGYSNVDSGTATALPTPPPGDIDCDGSVDSIDAALVLQVDAGLLSSAQCMEFADVNDDGVVNAVDAALLLQFDAGLIPSLPS
jgi:predicted phage tail protein